MDQRERLKHLLKSILGVDVDEIAGRVMARISVEQAVTAEVQTQEWKRARDARGSLVTMPGRLLNAGKKR